MIRKLFCRMQKERFRLFIVHCQTIAWICFRLLRHYVQNSSQSFCDFGFLSPNEIRTIVILANLILIFHFSFLIMNYYIKNKEKWIIIFCIIINMYMNVVLWSCICIFYYTQTFQYFLHSFFLLLLPQWIFVVVVVDIFQLLIN